MSYCIAVGEVLALNLNKNESVNIGAQNLSTDQYESLQNLAQFLDQDDLGSNFDRPAPTFASQTYSKNDEIESFERGGKNKKLNLA